ncbi:MAG: 50S ribosomal protein L11 [Candidatus Micrarchaeota archaeon]|nr:50S ribosomal protein L11 [Candidatus Micrarchaeota archaeon]
MADKTIDVIVDGGKASPGPPLAPALAPLGVNIGQVVAKINEATKAFAGMKVPVKVKVNLATKEFTVEAGSPPTAELLKKEAGIDKGAGSKETRSGNIKIEKIVAMAKIKSNSLGSNLKSIVCEIIGTCVSMGINVDGKDPKAVIAAIKKGEYDSLIS